jgi:predicted nucleic acid-binding protein
MRVFMDASAWVASAVKTDAWAPDFARVMAELRGQRIELFTTTWTLYEALAILRRRKPEAVDLLFQRATGQGSVLAVDPEIEQEALRRFLKWKDKGASVVDHANALVAILQHCDAILSFDDDFVPLAKAGGIRLLA